MNEIDTQNTIADSSTIEIPVGGAKWFHKDSCTACTVGLNERMKELVDTGMSKLKAAKTMSEESGGEIPANTIRARFDYYNGPVKKRPSEVAETCNQPEPPAESTIGKVAETCNPVDLDEQGELAQGAGQRAIKVIPLDVKRHELLWMLAEFFVARKIDTGIMSAIFDAVPKVVQHIKFDTFLSEEYQLPNSLICEVKAVEPSVVGPEIARHFSSLASVS